ncbi:MAG: InlB B-repeat-containing protein, partial [Oscillospiraceae bacterium]|nr:InlB B-repeat-containing protein [Oscillospiraceae bacterium]
FTRSSIIGDYGEFIHLLNNYDINYFLHDVNPNRVLMNLVELIYDANGGTGGPLRVGHPVNAWVRADSVHTVLTCLAANITAPPGYGLAGWSTVYDGSGRFYDVGSEINLADNIPINGNITLFAQWARWTVTFNLNGGTYMEAAIKRFCYKQCPMDKTQLR